MAAILVEGAATARGLSYSVLICVLYKMPVAPYNDKNLYHTLNEGLLSDRRLQHLASLVEEYGVRFEAIPTFQPYSQGFASTRCMKARSRSFEPAFIDSNPAA